MTDRDAGTYAVLLEGLANLANQHHWFLLPSPLHPLGIITFSHKLLEKRDATEQSAA